LDEICGGPRGEKVRRALEDERNVILTSSVTVAEVVSKFGREGLGTDAPYTAIDTSSRVVDLESDDAKEAGILHAATSSSSGQDRSGPATAPRQASRPPLRT
jgi:PIN domain nuclease of toxin-antitoxin system